MPKSTFDEAGSYSQGETLEFKTVGVNEVVNLQLADPVSYEAGPAITFNGRSFLL